VQAARATRISAIPVRSRASLGKRLTVRGPEGGKAKGAVLTDRSSVPRFIPITCANITGPISARRRCPPYVGGRGLLRGRSRGQVRTGRCGSLVVCEPAGGIVRLRRTVWAVRAGFPAGAVSAGWRRRCGCRQRGGQAGPRGCHDAGGAVLGPVGDGVVMPAHRLRGGGGAQILGSVGARRLEG
jgi:hypothetical protein